MKKLFFGSGLPPKPTDANSQNGIKKKENVSDASKLSLPQKKGGNLNSSFSSSQQHQQNNNDILNCSTNSHGEYSNASNNEKQTEDSLNKYKSSFLPERAQKVVEGVMEKYEQFKGIIDKQINPNKFQLSEAEIQKLTVQLADFDEYRQRIGNELVAYQNQKKKQSGTFEDHLQDMHLNKNLVNCFKRVPPIFFIETVIKDSFPFLLDVKINIKSIRDYQNELVDHLDEVELNLFHQVYFRFNQILEMILNFDKMGKKVEENLVKVKGVQQMNAKHKKTLCEGGNNIIKKKKQLIRISTTLNLLLKLKEYNENKDIKIQEDPLVISILNPTNNSNSSSNSSKNKLEQIQLFKVIKSQSEKISKLKERDMYADFLDESGKYLTATLQYSEFQKNKGVPAEYSIDISSINSYSAQLNGSSWIKLEDDEEEVEEGLQVFEWICNTEGQRNIEKEKVTEIEISKLYLISSLNFNTVRFDVFKNNVNKELAKFKQTLEQKFKDYCIKLYKQNNKQMAFSSQEGLQFLNDINDILLMKFSTFYSDLIQQFLKRSLHLLATIKQQIVASAISQNSSIKFWEQQIVPIIGAFSQFQLELADQMTQDLLRYIKYTDTSTDANIIFKLSTSNILFAFWVDQFPSFFNEQMQLDFSHAQVIPVNVQEELTRIISAVTQQFDTQFFYHQKLELHLELYSTFHEKQLLILESALSQDIWTPSSLQFKIYSLLDFFLKVKYTLLSKDKENEGGNNEDEDEEEEDEEEKQQFNKVRNQIIKDESDEEEDLQDLNHFFIKKTERQYKMQLNKIIFESENTKFTLTESMILFLRQLQRYIQLMNQSKTNQGRKMVAKIFEIIRYYNSYSREFIVLAKGIKKPQMQNKITVKNLASSAINLQFLQKILNRLEIKLSLQSPTEKVFIKEEVEKLVQEMENHSNEIFGTINNILKDSVQKASLQISTLGWHKPQEKINVPLVQTARVLDSVRTMHAVLEDILNQNQLILVFDSILNDVTSIYLKSFSSILLSQETNRLSIQRVKEEVTYIANELLEIQTIFLLPSNLMFASAIEGMTTSDQIPKLDLIKNKGIFIKEQEDLKLNQKETSQQKEDKTNEEIEKIAKKFSSSNKEIHQAQERIQDMKQFENDIKKE